MFRFGATGYRIFPSKLNSICDHSTTRQFLFDFKSFFLRNKGKEKFMATGSWGKATQLSNKPQSDPNHAWATRPTIPTGGAAKSTNWMRKLTINLPLSLALFHLIHAIHRPNWRDELNFLSIRRRGDGMTIKMIINWAIFSPLKAAEIFNLCIKISRWWDH